jgi:hypothetical protein
LLAALIEAALLIARAANHRKVVSAAKIAIERIVDGIV